MVNLIDDDLWTGEPALRPEDELALRRLHDMLHSTAEDLKLLSGELAQYRQPGVQVKTQPLPLDEEFNEKVHIQEVVNAKFHGHKIVDKTPIQSSPKIEKLMNVTYSKPNVNTGVQVDSVPVVKNSNKVKNLAVTRTRILEIEEKLDKNTENKMNNGKIYNSKVNKGPTIAYNEFTYKYEEPKVTATYQKMFKIQDLPSINIRSELKEQKVLQLDIYPDKNQNTESAVNKSNVGVIAAEHNVELPKEDDKITLSNKIPMQPKSNKPFPQSILTKKQPVRIVSKMSTCDSSGSTNVSSDTQHKLKTQKQIKSVIRLSPKTSARDRSKGKKSNITRKEPESGPHLNLDEWKKKLNTIYGKPSTSKSNKQSKTPKKYLKQSNITSAAKVPDRNHLNNVEYIPYSKLTLGGARVSDIEREISNIPNKNKIPLSPILDKILSSRENSFHIESSRNTIKKDSPRIFTTSDENLLEEVIDLEKKVSKTIKKNTTVKVKVSKAEIAQSVSSESKEEDEKSSYVDDFEDDKSDNTDPAKKDKSSDTQFERPKTEQSSDAQSDHDINKSDSESDQNTSKDDIGLDSNKVKGTCQNEANTSKSVLSFKNSVDVFEFVHSVDKQDTATQSNRTEKISLKETQTSPRNGRPNVQPIHNDLWPIDPKGELEKMFKLEKDFIKKLIIEEYGDILEKNISKPSTSKEANKEDKQKNVHASQKITQTSPNRVKSVMTSPAHTKTRTTSPFLSLTVDHQTSPMVVVTNEENLTMEIDNGEDCISINLSSPRFNLKLPQSSREVLSNLEGASVTPSKSKSLAKKDNVPKSYTFRKTVATSSSSEMERSSEMSSLGEVKFKLRRRYRKRVSSISESSESSVSKSSSDMPSGDIIPMRSEGEVSFKQMMRKGSNINSKSEGEASLGRTK